ncbi:hypothetical protein [Burkholderia ubonensis]|uniref:hypothetical protein n=1 Tax=Burkholderia ubonensis TaxID=101571 RepID=UPI00075F924B|nr:hypothetical protein [Burkholderia ubonensis]KWO65877.1 hypothetical protein WM31_20000 [Burkholderia ubonensis]
MVEYDGHKIDVRLTLHIDDPFGFETLLVLHRIWILLLLDTASRAVIGYTLALGREYNKDAPGESSLALLAKFQRLNTVSCAVLIDAFAYLDVRRRAARDLDLRDARRFDVPRMMTVLRLPLTDVAAASVMPSHRLERIAFATLRWCPKCSLEGVHLSAFQYRASEQCPIHRVRLAQHCEQCGATIPYRLRPDVFRAPFNYPSCAHPWFLPAHGPDNLRAGRTYRGLLRERLTNRLPAIRTEDDSTVHFRLPPATAWTVFARGDAIEGEAAGDETELEDASKSLGCGDVLAHGCRRPNERCQLEMPAAQGARRLS